jgi:hypothetical protein
MFSRILFCCMLAAASGDECEAVGGEHMACQGSDPTLLLQSRVRLSAEIVEELGGFTYGPAPSSSTFLDFFKVWSNGIIKSRLSRIIFEEKHESNLAMVRMESSEFTKQELQSMLTSLIEEECSPRWSMSKEGLALQIIDSEIVGEFGLRHFLLQDGLGRLQYLAVHQLPDGKHQALASDPPVCENFGSLIALETQPKPDELVEGRGKGSGDSNLLLPTDPLVTACKALFESTFVENCGGEKPNVTVLNARRAVVNGLEVHTRVKVCGQGGCFYHHPFCLYETSTDHTDASLLESISGPPEETKSLVASVELKVPICSVVELDDGSDSTGALLQQFFFGENSLYLGNEHVNDDIPSYSALEIEVPSELDFR